MSTITGNERRPGGRSGAAGSCGSDTLMVLPPGDILRALERHAYAVLVTTERSDGRITSQTFATLHAATKRVQNTRARGYRASATLVELRPVHAADHGLELLVGGRR